MESRSPHHGFYKWLQNRFPTWTAIAESNEATRANVVSPNFGGRIILIGTALLWMALITVLGFLLAVAPRGLEGTDEAAWALCAANPWKSPGWGIFFGFLLHPLWTLGFGHLVGFRIIGLLVLVIASFFLGQAMRRVSVAMGLGLAWRALPGVMPALSIAALAWYSNGNRTPDYNWILLVAGILFAAGWCLLEAAKSLREEGVAIWICAAGLVMAGIAKWTSLAGYFPLLTILVLVKFRGKQWLRIFLHFCLAMTVWAGLFFIYATPDGIQATIQAGMVLLETGSHAQILSKYAVGILKGSWQVVRAWPYVAVLYLISWLFFYLFRRQKPHWFQVAAVTFLAGIPLAVGRGHWLGGATHFSKGMMLTLVWLSGVAIMLYRTNRSHIDTPGSDQGPIRRVLWLLFLVPWANGIGTATGITDYLAYGVVFFAAMGFIMLAQGVQRGLPAYCAASAVLALGLIHAPRIASSPINSYRIGNAWAEMVPVASGPEKGRLMLFSSQVRALQSLFEDLGRLGFRPGDPLVGITDLAAPVYLLGGVSPGCCWYMGFLFGENIGIRKHLSHVDPKTLSRTWVLQRAGVRSFERLEIVWPLHNGIPPPQLVEKTYEWPWGDGAGEMELIRLYRPAALVVESAVGR